MPAGFIAETFDLANPNLLSLILVPLSTQDTRIKNLNVFWRFHAMEEDPSGNPLNPFPVFGFPVEEPSDSSTQYAIKTAYSEWELPHVCCNLYVMMSGKNDILINSVPLLNRGFPMNRDLISNVADDSGYLDLPVGMGLKCELVNDGYGIPDHFYGNVISIMGNLVVERDNFTAPITKVDASTSVTNTADGKTIKSGMLPKAGWEISGSESAPWAPGATYYEYGQGDLLYLIDSDDSTKWESATPGNSHNKKIQIHLGKEYQINGIRIKTGDFPNKLKGRILVSTDMGTWREVFPTGFLEGDINFAKVAARWISIECKVTDNTPYGVWHLYEINLFGDITQETEESNNPIISAMNWGLEYIYRGVHGSAVVRADQEPVDRIAPDSYLTISPDENGLPQMKYEPFNTIFPSHWNSSSKTPSERMTTEYSGIEIDLKQNYDIELIDAQFATSPKQWRGRLYGSKDKETWVSLASGFVSEFRRTAINFTQCRFLRLLNDPPANSLNGLSTPPRLNKLSIYAARSMQQIEPVTAPAEPAGYLDSNNLVLTPDELNLGALGNWGGFTPVSTAPSVVEISSRKVVRFNNGRGMTMPNDGRDFIGVTVCFRSLFPVWQRGGSNQFGMVFMPTYSNATFGRPYLLESGQTYFHGVPFPSSVRKNKVPLTAPFSLAPITDFMVVSIFWNTNSYTMNPSQPYYLATSNENYSIDIEIGDLIAWNSMPSETELIAVEDWMMSKFGIS